MNENACGSARRLCFYSWTFNTPSFFYVQKTKKTGTNATNVVFIPVSAEIGEDPQVVIYYKTKYKSSSKSERMAENKTLGLEDFFHFVNDYTLLRG